MAGCDNAATSARPSRRRGAARRSLVWLALTAATAPAAAFALPEATPWGRADGEACHDCHFLEPAVEASDALTLDGLPDRFVAGETYRLVLELEATQMRRAGFRVIARAPDGEAPGRFEAVDAKTETDGDRIRSTLAGSELDAQGRARWTFRWRAPERPRGPVKLDVSANAANDDASPFGDVIHRRRISVEPAEAE